MPRKKKNSTTICVFCKLPIRSVDRPAVRLEKGKQAHMECYLKTTDGKSTSVH